MTISWNGYCSECGERAEIENLRQLVSHSGPRFEHWRRRIAASVGGVLND